ncbi:CDP-glycerol glycerophosphotransferase family protein [Leucobacter sp. NPDC058333]|uniref:bifunctional glycosyltransferase/CDP-glycerol:glycerophosphate glycerophosphotransferase n=1 Tax=Leucobacter sp. NPDC058333 TaxID=3346450 RepID=UPI0036644EB3
MVVPVYNVAQYLDQCLSSVLRQGLGDALELVLVEDGSTDGSELIARKWARRHPQIELIERSNGGLSAARNTGLDAARGEFVTFLDSDDIVPDGVYQKMVTRLQASGSDFITSAPYRFAGWKRFATPFNRNADLFSKSVSGLTLESAPEYVRDFTAWNKVYRRKFFVESGIRFPEGRIYEDVATSPMLYSRAAAFDVLGEVGYFWRVTPGGITQTILPVKAVDRLWAVDRVQRYFHESGASAELVSEVGFAIVDYNLRWIFLEYYRFDSTTREHILQESERLLADVPDTVIARVQSPLSTWAMLAKRGRTSELAEILRVQQDLPDIRVRESSAERNALSAEEPIDDERIEEGEIPGAMADDAVMERKTTARARRLIEGLAPSRTTQRRVRNAVLYLVMRPILFRLPVLPRTAVFSAYWGRKFSLSDGPAALCVELNRLAPEFQSVVFAGRRERDRVRAAVRELVDHPNRVRVVLSSSFRAHYYLWRAKYLFNDVNFQVGFRVDRGIGKRPDQIEVQTTHGIPIKKMGIDSEAAIDPSQRDVFLERSQRYDYLVASSPEVGATFARSHGVTPKLLQTGLPQHDVLFQRRSSTELEKLRAKYSLDPRKRIALYAPTFRNDNGAVFPYLIDFEVLQERLGDDYQIVVKPHPFNHTQLSIIDFRELTDFALAPQTSPFIKLMGEVRRDDAYVAATLDYEASRSEDQVLNIEGSINELMEIADVVVSDYSSLMFGYMHLQKPLVLFTPDIGHYEASRGSYFNVDDVAPGAVAKDTEELADALRLAESIEAWNVRYATARSVFIDRFLEWERGGASRRILADIGLIASDAR